MKTYKKKPLTYSEQVELLKNRGLIINNVSRAERYLSEISYYRLSAYYIPYCSAKDCFDTGSTFDHILNLYLFDRELRLIVFDAIERIEVAIRTQMIYQLSHKYKDSHWQDNAAIFKPPFTNNRTGKIVHIYQETQNIINKHKTSDRPEVFIKHYTATYNSPKNPPGWMSIEILTIGELSRLYTAFKKNSDRQSIAHFFGLPHKVFTSWLHTLVYVRNICAHHSRLWNREFAIRPEVIRNPNKPWVGKEFDSNNHRCFYFICVLKYLLRSANPSNSFRERFIALLEKYPNVPIGYMGIPTTDGTTLIDWKNEPLWIS